MGRGWRLVRPLALETPIFLYTWQLLQPCQLYEGNPVTSHSTRMLGKVLPLSSWPRLGSTLGQANASWLAKSSAHCPWSLHCLFLCVSQPGAYCLRPALSTALLNACGTSGLRNHLQLSKSQRWLCSPLLLCDVKGQVAEARVLPQRRGGASVQAQPRSYPPMNPVLG